MNMVFMMCDMERLKRAVELIDRGAIVNGKLEIEEVIFENMGLIFDNVNGVWIAKEVD